MAKDPAFLFYPNDYIGGTMGMTFEEKGAYMELLMTQFNRGHMTSHMIAQVVGQNWDKLKDKFIKDENGLWYNERLEEEKSKRQNYTKSRRNNVSGNNQHTKNKGKNDIKKEEIIDGHMTSHMEDENIVINNTLTINKNSNEIKDSNSWESEKKLFQNEEQYFYKIATSYKITKNDVLAFVDVFLKELELAEDYKDLKELKRHFSYWLKKRKEEKERKNKYQQTEQPKIQTLRKLPNSPTPRYD
jgi:uncharacterized protein YdaU (DUF1376 family)